MAETEAKTAQEPSREALAQDIERNVAELRDDIVKLTRMLRDYGSLTADDTRHRAADLTNKALEQASRKLHELGKRLAALEGPLESNVKEHPLGWLSAALGFGLILSFLLSRRH